MRKIVFIITFFLVIPNAIGRDACFNIVRGTLKEGFSPQKISFESAGGLKPKSENNILFRHSTFDDFSGGTVSNSGHNLFVSHDGQIRFVNWFDLNNDGYPEIVSVNDHNPYENSDGIIYYNHASKGFMSLMPPLHKFVPGFQQLEWMEESLKHMDRLPALGGGTTLVEDLNSDGYTEILFTNFVHGWSDNHYPVSLYWGDENGINKTRVSYLPTLTASGLATADLDGNGYKDIIMANVGREAFASVNASGSASGNGPERIIGAEEGTSYIYWQEAWGFSEDNRGEFPTEYALDVSVADLNQDGYTDVVFLQGGIPGSIRIFYGGQTGIDTARYRDIEVLAPVWGSIVRKILIADLNGDNKPDIFVPSVGGSSEIFWNGTGGLSQSDRSVIPSRDALDAAAEDLNGNGYNDLVVVNQNGPSYIYWNSPGGFSEDRRTGLPTNVATGVAISDLDKDGFFDIVFSNSQDGESYDNPSFIYWGSKDGYHPGDRDELWGFGPVDVSVADFDKNGLDDIFLMNRQSGHRSPQYGISSYNSVDLFVYWGNKRSRYSVASMSLLPGARPQSSALATDLTGNGYADLVYLTDQGKTLNVFYGDNKGFSADKNSRYDIQIQGRTPLTADLDKDGYLDFIVESDKNELAVLLGKKEGFEEVQLYVFDGLEHDLRTQSTGDINGDGNLDLLFGGHGFIKILYGTGQGSFDIKQIETIKTNMYTTKISVADLNEDGLPDIFGHHHTPANRGGEYSVYSAIYWNNNGSFSGGNRLELPSHGAHSGSIADVNKDGYPDILIANYNAQHTRNLETFVYWGGSKGSFSPQNVTKLPGYSPIANLVLDLNGDGINEIVVYNHSKSNRIAGSNPLGGMHALQSYIYWGTENGWHINNRDEIPTFGPHGRLVAEPGDIMNRSSYEEYTSIPIALDGFSGLYNLKVESNHNFRQNIKVFIKSANGTGRLEQAEWKEIKLTDRTDDYFLYEGSLTGKDTFMKYKLRLITGETGNGPVVKAVEMYK